MMSFKDTYVYWVLQEHKRGVWAWGRGEEEGPQMASRTEK